MTKSKNALNPRMIIALLFMGNLVSALDRFIVNYGIVHISDDLQLNASSTGLILSIFFLGYAIMQIPGGWLADRFGAKLILFISIIGFSIFTGLTGLAWSFASLVAIRFIFGLTEGSFFPAGAKTISVTIPEERRSRAMSIFLSALTVAGIAAPILASVLLVQVGWRYMFMSVGICGFIIGLLYWIYLKPTVANEPTETIVKSPAKGSLKVVLKTPLIWSLLLAAFSYGFISWGLASWTPTYLVNVRGLDLKSLGVLQMIPAVTSFCFFILAGVILDKVKPGFEKWIGAFSGIGLGIMVYLMFNASSVTGVIIYQSIAPLFSGLLSVIIFSLPLKRLPEDIGGSAVGVVNFGTQMAGFMAPLAIGFTIDMLNGSYNGAVGLMTSFGVLCFIAFLTLNSKKQQVTDENASESIPVA